MARRNFFYYAIGAKMSHPIPSVSPLPVDRLNGHLGRGIVRKAEYSVLFAIS